MVVGPLLGGVGLECKDGIGITRKEYGFLSSKNIVKKGEDVLGGKASAGSLKEIKTLAKEVKIARGKSE